jgi:hypothetical protein
LFELRVVNPLGWPLMSTADVAHMSHGTALWRSAGSESGYSAVAVVTARVQRMCGGVADVEFVRQGSASGQ